MGKVLVNDTTLTSIGNAIRNKTGKTELLLPSEMPKEITSISSSGNKVEYLGDVELGSLYKDGIAVPKSKRPWSKHKEFIGTLEPGDIPDLQGYNYSLGDKQVGCELIFHKFRTPSNHPIMGICNQVIGEDLSVYDIQQKFLGKKVIDNQNIESFLLTAENIGSLWEDYIRNDLQIEGIPTPNEQDYDTKKEISEVYVKTPHNQFWNWIGIFSLCQGVSMKDFDTSLPYCYFGQKAPNTRGFLSYTTRYSNVGYRPAVVFLDEK